MQNGRFSILLYNFSFLLNSINYSDGIHRCHSFGTVMKTHWFVVVNSTEFGALIGFNDIQRSFTYRLCTQFNQLNQDFIVIVFKKGSFKNFKALRDYKEWWIFDEISLSPNKYCSKIIIVFVCKSRNRLEW